jgi:hypothetical protein
MYSAKQILVASLAALAVALAVLVAAVLPAEFGIDPIGSGRAFGLLALYDADADPISPPAAPDAAAKPRSYHTDSRELSLGPGQSFEFKYRLAKDRGMVYAWKSTRPLKYEFHGEPSDRAIPVTSYEKGEGDYGSGTLTASFSGIHGWYWENAGSEPLTITIASAGFFTTAEEFRSKWDPDRHKDRIEQTTYEFPAATAAPPPAK